MPTTVRCPNCREPLDVPPDLRGRPVQCASCQTVFTPPPEGVPPVRPAAPRDQDDDPRFDDTDDDRPRRRRRPAPPKGSSLGIWIVLGILGLFGCGCCGGFGVLVWKVMDPNFEPYASADGTFDAIFPAEVHKGRRLTGRAGGESADSLEARRDWVQETFFLYSVDPSIADRKKGNDKLLDEFADGVLVGVPGGRETRLRSRRTHAGLPAMDVTVQHPGEDIRTIARVVAAKDRIYVIGVTGPGQPGEAPWVEKFLDGLTIK